jgi:hypothetical protein
MLHEPFKRDKYNFAMDAQGSSPCRSDLLRMAKRSEASKVMSKIIFIPFKGRRKPTAINSNQHQAKKLKKLLQSNKL